jgi:hypothetical protein
LRQGVGNRACFKRSETPTSQSFAQRPANSLVVIDYQYLFLCIFRQKCNSLSGSPHPKPLRGGCHYIRGALIEKAAVTSGKQLRNIAIFS